MCNMRLKVYLAIHDMTYTELAKQLECSVGYLYRIAQEQCLPSKRFAQDVERVTKGQVILKNLRESSKEYENPLKLYLDKHKIKYGEFAQKLGCSRGYLSRVMNEKSIPSKRFSKHIERLTEGEVFLEYSPLPEKKTNVRKKKTSSLDEVGAKDQIPLWDSQNKLHHSTLACNTDQVSECFFKKSDD